MKRTTLVTLSVRVVAALTVLSANVFMSCGSDEGEPNNPDIAPTAAKGNYFIAVKADDGTEYVMQAESLEEKDLNIKDNIFELPTSEYTWVFKDDKAIGMVYQQQFAGIGYAMRLSDPEKAFEKLGEFRIESRYSNFGFFNGGFVTSVGGQVSSDGSRNDGATFAFFNLADDGVSLNHTKTLWTEDLTGNGQQITFSSIVDDGDGTFLSAIVQSDFNQTGTGNGSSVGDVKYPDSVWVARLDEDLNVRHIYRDDRISYAAGQYRSQVFQEVFKADNGNVYVFSNAFNTNTTRKAAALRITPGADAFDPAYYFDLQTPADGYKFRRVWYVGGDKFLLELYNNRTPGSIEPGHHYAIVSMEEKKFQKVEGLPAMNLITSGAETGGVPLSHGGKVYLPITQYGSDAVIYVIDPETAQATAGITLKGVKEVRTLGYLEAK